ncbi:AAA family ATPase [Paenibacillus sp. sptzw28]|uniref:AAA family ATPase n=1 Tax=Paenibacillus sp. sptzw28 TaxID=715179 RepID=UPI001C6F559E|nr:ATP-binding protein [Paenibacillus sp. sptzw28]QYR19444.1 AAA family ATPase [Paenibacillus sp. sptzw28]
MEVGIIAALHLMVGLPCSGKTTLARQLEQKYSALRLTPDEWHTRLFGQDVNETGHSERHDLVESLLWDVAARVLELGVDVILDFGFWVRSQRDDMRLRAAELGAEFKIHFADAPAEDLTARLAARNTELPPGAAYIPESTLKEWMLVFEPPFPEELGYTLVY